MAFDPSTEERFRALSQARDVVVNLLAKLGSEYNWRVDEVVSTQTSGAVVKLHAIGWPSLVIEVDIQIGARVIADPLTP